MPNCTKGLGGAAIPVKYDNVPRLFDDDFLIRLGSGQESIASKPGIEALLNKFVTAKAKDWAYEREWRVVIHLTNPQQTTEDIRFHPRELAAVYLGCRMPDEDKANCDHTQPTLSSNENFSS
jgi:hypothetical protein